MRVIGKYTIYILETIKSEDSAYDVLHIRIHDGIYSIVTNAWARDFNTAHKNQDEAYVSNLWCEETINSGDI